MIPMAKYHYNKVVVEKTEKQKIKTEKREN
jgi:hypothetical protein